MAKFTFRNITFENDSITEANKRSIVAEWLRSRQPVEAPAPTDQEIDAALAKWEAEPAQKIAGMPGWANWTDEQADQWVVSNVKDLPSAITALRAMVKMLVYLRDR